MKERDYILGQNEQGKEAFSFYTFRKENFAPDTLGFKVFPDILEGR